MADVLSGIRTNGVLARPEAHFTTTDYWRFWVVHLGLKTF
jgi:hypothetical protein